MRAFETEFNGVNPLCPPKVVPEEERKEDVEMAPPESLEEDIKKFDDLDLPMRVDIIYFLCQNKLDSVGEDFSKKISSN